VRHTQLGFDDTRHRTMPAAPTGLRGLRFKSVAAGGTHCVAIVTEKGEAEGGGGGQVGAIESLLGAIKSSLGDAESSLGDANSSLGDAKSSLGAIKSWLCTIKSSLGDAESSLGEAKSSLGDAESSLGDANSFGLREASEGHT
jgi:hypothetical protein